MPETVTECAECHLTSTLESQFRIGFTKAGKRARLCPVCWRRDQASNSRIRAYWLLGVGVVGLLLPDCPLRWFLLGVTGGFFLSYALTPLHEAAHALTAWALGFHVCHYKIGWWSEPYFWRRWGRCTFELCSVVEGGMVLAVTPNQRWMRLRQIMVIAAGPGFHLILVVMAVVVRMQAPLGSWMEWLATVVFLTNGFEFVHNAYPREVPSPDGPLGTDGMLLLKWCFSPAEGLQQQRLAYFYHEGLHLLRSNKVDEAVRLMKTARAEFPDELVIHSLDAVCRIESREWDEARSRHQKMRQRADLEPEWEAMFVNNIAHINLMTHQPELLPEALAYSQQAYAAIPWVPTVKGTRGATLVAAGQLEEGLCLLHQAFQQHREPQYKAINAAYIAWGLHQQGDAAAARHHLEIAKKLNPHDASMERIETILQQSTQMTGASS